MDTGYTAPTINNLVGRLDASSNPGIGAPADASTSLGFGKGTTVYHLPPGHTDGHRRLVMMYMTLCARSTDPRTSAWQTFFISYSILVFPDLLSDLRRQVPGGDYVYELYPPEFVGQLREAVTAQGTEDTAGPKVIPPPYALPTTIGLMVDQHLVGASSHEALIAHYAMVLFLIGKSNIVDSAVAITTTRPQALIRRCQLQAQEFILMGNGKINPESYALIRSGYVKCNKPREVIIDRIARFMASSNRPEVYTALVINMELLKNVNQSYIFVIRDGLVACPFMLELPSVRMNYRALDKMVEHLTNQPSHIQPYYKLAVQDNNRVINRRDLDNILAVATVIMVQSRPNMAQYRIAQSALPVVNEFLELARTKGYNFTRSEGQQTTTVEAN